jgi:histidinol-phosphatase (PHP family)
VDETLDVIATSGLPVELNTAGWRKGLGEPYPAPRILEGCADRGIPVIINSDSHTPGEVDQGFDLAADCLAALEIEPVTLGRPRHQPVRMVFPG